MARTLRNVAITSRTHVVLQRFIGLHAAHLDAAECTVPDGHSELSANERPCHERRYRDHRGRDHEDVARTAHAFAMRIETHANSIVGAMETVRVDRKDGIVTVTMSRPERKNAANVTMWTELLATFREVAASPDDRVMVLTGDGGEFCSGADLSGGGMRDEHGLARMRNINDVCLALARIPQPTIAKVRGVAVGAGCNMAFICDLVVASDNASFSEIFSKRGLSLDFGGAWVLPRRVGLHRAKELAFFADILSAAEVAEFGLVNRVVDDASLDVFVDKWASRLAAGPPIALAQTKKMLNSALDMTLEQALDAEAAAQTINFQSKDTVEAMLAFNEKREPRFTGK